MTLLPYRTQFTVYSLHYIHKVYLCLVLVLYTILQHLNYCTSPEIIFRLHSFRETISLKVARQAKKQSACVKFKKH